MAAFLDVCRFVPTLGGTTDWTYSAAVTGYQSPTAAGAQNGVIYRYRAESADLSQWEIGYGAYNSSTGVFARTTVLYNSAGNTSKISFSTVPQVAIVALSLDVPSLTKANAFTGNMSVGGTFIATAKGHFLGTAGGTAATGAVTTADANVIAYDSGSGNWAGWGIDVSGNMWFRVGLSGSPVPAFYLNATDQSANFPSAVAGVGTNLLGITSLTVNAASTTGLAVINTSPTPAAGGGGGTQSFALALPTASGHRLAFITMGYTDLTTNRSSAAIAAFASEAWTAGSAQGTYVDIQSTPNGSATRTTAMRIQPSGGVGIGTTSDPGIGNLMLKPGASVTPAANGDLTFQATSNTSFTIKYKGSDGVVRSASLTLT